MRYVPDDGFEYLKNRCMESERQRDGWKRAYQRLSEALSDEIAERKKTADPMVEFFKGEYEELLKTNEELETAIKNILEGRGQISRGPVSPLDK